MLTDLLQQHLSDRFILSAFVVGICFSLWYMMLLVIRVGWSAYHAVGVAAYTWRSAKALGSRRHAAWACPFIALLQFFDCLVRGRGAVIQHNGWAERGDGKKVNFSTWRGGFDYEVNDVEESLTRAEHMLSYGDRDRREALR